MSNVKTGPKTPSRILLVDDNRQGNAARKSVLESQGFVVETALSGEEALEVLQSNPFDLVVTDFQMKKMNGLELIAQLRRDKPGMKIVLLSGWSCLGFTEESTGADAVLCKSNKEQEHLLRAVQQLLSRRPSRSAQTAARGARTHVARSG